MKRRCTHRKRCISQAIKAVIVPLATFDYEEWLDNEQPVDTITNDDGIIRFGYTPYLGNGSTIA